MKFRLTFKTPDALDALYDMDLTDEQYDECYKTVDMWLKWGELITVEFDTETTTAIVVK